MFVFFLAVFYLFFLKIDILLFELVCSSDFFFFFFLLFYFFFFFWDFRYLLKQYGVGALWDYQLALSACSFWRLKFIS